MRFMLNWLFTSIAIAIATFLVPGIQPFGFAEAWVCFAFVGLFLNIVDSFVKPFLTVISLPLTIITLGIFQLVLNSFMLELASYLSVNLLGVGISIAGFGSAFMGSILVSIMRSILDSLAEEYNAPIHRRIGPNQRPPIAKMGGLLICQVSEGKKIYHFHPVPKWQVWVR